MSIAVAPDTRVTFATGEGHEIINHYFAKEDMTRAIVTGEKILALCGHIGHVAGHGGGNMTRRTRGVLVVCEPCRSVFDSL